MPTVTLSFAETGLLKSARRRLRAKGLCAVLAFSSSACSKSDDSPPAAAPSAAPATGQSTAQDPASAPAAEPQKGLLAVGTMAPDFQATAHTGQVVKLSELRGKVVVLYFYPRDDTPGCTAEAQAFRDDHDALTGAGAVILGVSSQDNESHREFAEKHGLPFLLLPDEDKKLAESFGVGSFLGMTNRVTFVIDRAGKIAKVYPKVSPKNHADEIARDLQGL